MKKLDNQSPGFRELSTEEYQVLRGGGFAYDVGRLLRFVVLSGPNGQFTPKAIVDFCATQML